MHTESGIKQLRTGFVRKSSLSTRHVETLQKHSVPVRGCRISLWWKGSAVHTYHRPGLQTWFSFFSLLLVTWSPVGFFCFTVELTMTMHSGLVLKKWFLTWWGKLPLHGQKALNMQKMLSWNKYWNDLWQNWCVVTGFLLWLSSCCLLKY